MKKQKEIKELRKQKRKDYLEWWQTLSKEQKHYHIKENQQKHQEIFLAKKEKEELLRETRKKNIAILRKHKAKVMTEDCLAVSTQTPSRNKITGKILSPYFSVFIAARIVKEVKERGLERIHVAITIRNPKDTHNFKIALSNLGERMTRNSEFSFEFNIPTGTFNKENDDYFFEYLCWTEFNTYLRRPGINLPYQFVRSWIEKELQTL